MFWDRETAPASNIQLLWPSWLGKFGFLLGSFAGVVKRVAGVGGGAKSSRTFFFTFATLKNNKESSQTLDITAKSANPTPAFRGIVVSRKVSCFAPSRFPPFRGLVMQRVTGVGGGARTCAAREGVPD